MNNSFTLFMLSMAFIAIFGSIAILGNESLSNNDNLDSESIASIRNLDTELYANFEINASSGVITGTRIEDDRTTGVGASTDEQQEFIEPRTNANDIEDSYDTLKKVPSSVVGGIWFIQADDIKFFTGILVSILSVSIALAFYSFWRTGRTDKQS